MQSKPNQSVLMLTPFCKLLVETATMEKGPPLIIPLALLKSKVTPASPRWSWGEPWNMIHVSTISYKVGGLTLHTLSGNQLLLIFGLEAATILQ